METPSSGVNHYKLLALVYLSAIYWYNLDSVYAQPNNKYYSRIKLEDVQTVDSDGISGVKAEQRERTTPGGMESASDGEAYGDACMEVCVPFAGLG